MTQAELTPQESKNVARGCLLCVLVIGGGAVALLGMWRQPGLLTIAIAILGPVAIGILGFKPYLMAWIAIVLTVVAISPPGCAVLGSSPQLLLDPISAAIYRAPTHEERSWRSVDVALPAAELPVGSTFEAVRERLNRSGYEFEADYRDYPYDYGGLTHSLRASAERACFASSEWWLRSRSWATDSLGQ